MYKKCYINDHWLSYNVVPQDLSEHALIFKDPLLLCRAFVWVTEKIQGKDLTVNSSIFLSPMVYIIIP